MTTVQLVHFVGKIFFHTFAGPHIVKGPMPPHGHMGTDAKARSGMILRMKSERPVEVTHDSMVQGRRLAVGRVPMLMLSLTSPRS